MPKELTTITWYSKLLALITFFVLLFMTFQFGVLYNEAQNIHTSRIIYVSKKPIHTDVAEVNLLEREQMDFYNYRAYNLSFKLPVGWKAQSADGGDMSEIYITSPSDSSFLVYHKTGRCTEYHPEADPQACYEWKEIIDNFGQRPMKQSSNTDNLGLIKQENNLNILGFDGGVKQAIEDKITNETFERYHFPDWMGQIYLQRNFSEKHQTDLDFIFKSFEFWEDTSTEEFLNIPGV